MNIAKFTDADWMIVATMIMRIPERSTGFRPYLSENHPTRGSERTEPMD